jgi:hypothetical protein
MPKAMTSAMRGGAAAFAWLALVKIGLLAGAALAASVHALVH